MSRSLWILVAGVALLGAAALAAIFVATEPSPGVAGAGRSPVPGETAAGSPAASLRAPPALPPFPALPPVPAPGAAPAPVPPEGTAAAWVVPEDRAEVQTQRLERGMQGLNERAARRAALAGQPVPAPGDPAPGR